MRAGAQAEDRAREIEEALREDPGHPVALLRRSQGLVQPERAALAREATRTHPQSWQAWVFLATSTSRAERCVKEAALRRAAALAPENPRVLNDLAWTLVQGGRAPEAMAHAKAAAQLEPWNAAVLDTYAAAAAEMGRCSEAVRAAERALELAADDLTAAERDAVASRLAHYRAGCGAERDEPVACPDEPQRGAAPGNAAR
jgi:tetratricopeptide (TPR) repeat protein